MSDIYIHDTHIKGITVGADNRCLHVKEMDGDCIIWLTREQVAQMQAALALLYPEPPRPLFNATPTDEERELRTCLVKYADEHAHEAETSLETATRLSEGATRDANSAFIAGFIKARNAAETSEPQQMSTAARLIFDAANDANRAYLAGMKAGGAA